MRPSADLVTAADVFLADEPTAELDADNRGLIVSLLIERARTGAVVVIASHDPDVVDACDESWICERAMPESGAPAGGQAAEDAGRR